VSDPDPSGADLSIAAPRQRISVRGAALLGTLPVGDEPDLATCCAALYAHPAVRWLLGEELHPGGERTTRRALGLAAVRAGDRLLDLACGDGTSALLAARELGCTVVGIDYGLAAIERARRSAEVAGLDRRVKLRVGDAQELVFPDGAFDAVLCECALSTFADQPGALAEARRVLRSGGRLALSDVVVDRQRLPAQLGGALASVACVGGAHSRSGYEEMLAAAGLRPIAHEQQNEEAAAFAERIRDRLRGARLLGLERLEGSPVSISEAIELVELARRAIVEGALGYSILIATG
jgi:arsenite methyltransferase